MEKALKIDLKWHFFAQNGGEAVILKEKNSFFFAGSYKIVKFNKRRVPNKNEGGEEEFSKN